VPFTAFRSGYTLVETWHATSVLHSLRSLRAFRCYPSRRYARAYTYAYKKRSVFNSLTFGGGWAVMLSSFFEVRFFKIRTTYRVGCCAQCSINSLNKISIIKFYLLKKTANIQIYVELNITGRVGGKTLKTLKKTLLSR